MKNTRKAREGILKLTAGGMMLALLFAIVFAGTLSGAFGVEKALENVGVIESSVALAADKTSTYTFDSFGTFQVIANAKRTGALWHERREDDYHYLKMYFSTGLNHLIGLGKVKIKITGSYGQDGGSDKLWCRGWYGDGAYDVDSTQFYSFGLTSLSEDAAVNVTILDTTILSSTQVNLCTKAEDNGIFSSICSGFYNIVVTLTFVDDDTLFDGAGTSNSPYALTKRADFNSLSALVSTSANNTKYNSQSTVYSVKPNTNITGQSDGSTIAMGTDEFTPIGNASNSFKGTVEGNNKTVSTVTIANNTTNAGLFGVVEGGTIRNMKVVSYINGGGDNHGGLVGQLKGGTISGCTVSISTWGNGYIGGVVGLVSAGSTISGCTVNNGGNGINWNGSSGGNSFTGGIVGGVSASVTVTISGCTNNSAITISNSGARAVGGIVGGILNGANITITNCTNSGSVTAAEANGVAGILGCSESAANKINISRCKNTATIQGGLNTGGIGGIIESTETESNALYVHNCYNSGTVEAKSTNTVGGIIGYYYGNSSTAGVAKLEYCFSSGAVSAKDGTNAGAIVGNPSGIDTSQTVVSHCYTTQNMAISGTSGAATINPNNYVIVNGTTAPSFSNGGSYLLYNSCTLVPTHGTGYTATEWTNITSDSIDGFKLTASMSDGYYFLSQAGKGGSGLKPSKLDSGYSSSSSFNLYAYYSAGKGNIYCNQDDITVSGSSVTYDGAAHSISVTKPSGGIYTTTAGDSATNAGSYSRAALIYVTGDDGNQKVVGRKAVTLAIAKRVLTVNTLNYNYGQKIEPTVSGLFGNVVSGQTVSGSLAKVNASDNVYGAISDSYKNYSYTLSGFDIKDSSSKSVIGNYDIKDGSGNSIISTYTSGTTVTVRVNAGDFGVAGTTDIANNKWGSSGNPYLISNETQLKRLAEIVNGATATNSINSSTYVYSTATSKTYSGAYFRVDAYIRASSFTPIGKITGDHTAAASNYYQFAGVFNGNNNTIEITVTTGSYNGNYAGLFGFTNGATISNLTIAGTVSGSSYVGGLIGHASNTTLNSCKNTADVTGSGSYVGGLIGQAGNLGNASGNGCTINGGENSAKITSTGGSYVGGLVGHSRDTYYSGTIINKGEVFASNASNVGGISGDVNGGTLKNGENTANITGKSVVGGLTGLISWGKIEGTSQNSGTIIGSGSYVGGIAGRLTKSNAGDSSYIKGTLTNNGCVKGSSYVGGIIGEINNTSTRNDTFAWTATVSITSSTLGNDGDGVLGGSYVGGAIGRLSGGVVISGTILVGDSSSTTERGCDVDSNGYNACVIGGAVGRNDGELSATITVKARVIARGNGGTVDGNGGSFAGGIVGYNTGILSGTFNKTNGDTISVDGLDYVGGICAYNSGQATGTFAHSSTYAAHPSGNMSTVYGGSYVGGCFGYSIGSVTNCTNSGSVYGASSGDKTYTIAQYDAYATGSTEGVDKFNDGNTGTKFCTTDKSAMSFIAEITGDKLFVVGFKITSTKGDTEETGKNRTPKKVQIWGSNTNNRTTNYSTGGGNTPDKAPADGWTSVYSSDNIGLGYDTSSIKSKTITFSVPTVYKYYWVHITGTSGLQFSEFDLLGAQGNAVGGIVGYLDGGSVSSNTNSGKVLSSGSNGVGGIVGSVAKGKSATITSCTNNGTVTAESANGVAGIVGYTVSGTTGTLKVSKCRNDGAITGKQNVGGIGGRMETALNNATSSLWFTNCYNKGNITEKGGGTVGGIAGYFFTPTAVTTSDTAVMEYCFSEGQITGTGNAGAIVGNPRGQYTASSVEIRYCYTTVTNKSISGTGNATVSNNNYVLASGSTAPSVTNGGSYLLYNGTAAPTPQVGLGDTTSNAWTDILNQNINGFKVSATINPTSGQYFVSKKTNASGEDLSPNAIFSGGVNDSTTESFSVAAKYNASRALNIYCAVGTIAVDTTATTYNAQNQYLSVTAPSSNGGVYTDAKIYYTGISNNNKGQEVPKNAGTYNVVVVVKLKNIDNTEYVVGKRSTTYKINQFDISSSSFGANTNLLVGNSTLNTSLNIYPLDNALVYSRHNYEKKNFVVIVKYAGREGYNTIVFNTDYKIEGELKTPSKDKQIEKVGLTANGIGNFTGTLTGSFTAMISDFGGNYDQADWGNSSNPFEISATEHLIRLSEIVNGTSKAWNSIRTSDTNLCATNNTKVSQYITTRTYSNAYFKMSGSVNMSDYFSAKNGKSFTPIGRITQKTFGATGSVEYPFSGTFDGNGQTINKVYVNTSGVYYVGLFGYIKGVSNTNKATIKDITIYGSVNGSGADATGGLVALAGYNSVITGKINAGTGNGDDYKMNVTGVGFVGGVVGRSHGDMSGATFVHGGNVVGTSSSVGGILGFTGGAINGAQNNGTVKGTVAVGGIVGRIQGTISGSTNNAAITSTEKDLLSASGELGGGIANFEKLAAVGGITGYSNGTISGCTNTGTISAEGANGVGGIVGVGGFYTNNAWTGISITGCSSQAAVTGRNYTGGIAGYWVVPKKAGADISDWSLSSISVTGNTYVGALCGWVDASACTSSLTITPTQKGCTVTGKNCVGYFFGGFVGNGYHKTANAKIYSRIIINEGNVSGTVVGKDGGAVLGGLVGFVSNTGIEFTSNYSTGSITMNSLTNVGFVGGIAGILGENATLASTYQLDANGNFVTGEVHQIKHNNAFGDASNPLGNFVGGIAGYITSNAGIYYDSTSTIIGNGVQLINTESIYGTSYVGGIFGAMGTITDASAVLEKYEISSYLTNLLASGTYDSAGSIKSTIKLSPSTQGSYGAKGKLINDAGYVSASNSYAGGIVGYVGGDTAVTFENDASTITDTNLTTSSNYAFTVGSHKGYYRVLAAKYAGGLIGYLSDGSHSFKNIALRIYMGDNTSAQYVGGIVGYMVSGSLEGCITMYPDDSLNSGTSVWKGSDYVGGLVGYTVNATISNCLTLGFKLSETTNTKDGLVGFGVSPSISSSWAFYAAEAGSTYATTSQNTYGKFVAVDSNVLYQFTYSDVLNILNDKVENSNNSAVYQFKVYVPSATVKAALKNYQLVFYDASGSDVVTNNEFKTYGASNVTINSVSVTNGLLTIALDKENASSMLVYTKLIEFVDVPQSGSNYTGENSDKKVKETVEACYKKPSGDGRYSADVTTATYTNNQISKIVANVYFNGVLTGTVNKQTGSYDKSFTVGAAESPYTISNVGEWESFAKSVREGTNSYSGKYVSLLNDITIDANDNLAGALGKPFSGIFNGNDHSIILSTTLTGTAAGTSLFPYASNATFQNLTIKGTSESVKIDSSYDGTAAFVGVAGGTLTFENCTNQLEITSSAKNVGGILGQTHNATSTYTFIDCVNEGVITCTSTTTPSGVGGIVGNVVSSGDTDADDGTVCAKSVELESCRNAANITARYNVAGIIGRSVGYTNIKNCGNSGNITAGGENFEQKNNMDTNVGGIGGLVANNATINVYASYNSGKLIGWGNKAGGILAADCSYTTSAEQSKIYYCYNTGDVYIGGTDIPDDYSVWSDMGCNIGVNGGGILGTMVNSDIRYCYNTGNIVSNGINGAAFAWKARVGGIVGFIDGTSSKSVLYCYNVGQITLNSKGGSASTEGAGQIVGSSKNSDAANSLTTMVDGKQTNYSLKNALYRRHDSKYTDTVADDGGKDNQSENWSRGTVLDSISDFTAYFNKGTTFAMSGFKAGQKVNVLTDGITSASGGYIYVYGCLPQLAVFAVDTQNGLAMTSVAYGKDQYGTFNRYSAGSEYNPYIIKDGIDLLGMQALLECGYSFAGKYIEFANSKNNLTGAQATQINFPTYASTDVKYNASDGGYQSTAGKGKSYHLFEKSAVCADDFNGTANEPYQDWCKNNTYQCVTSGKVVNTSKATFSVLNMPTLGRTIGKAFRGNISGEQFETKDGKEASTTTKLNNVKISADYAGLFSVTKNATVSYIELTGASTVYSEHVAGGIVARPRGTTVVDNCAISGSTTVKSYGTDTKFSYSVGGIVGYAFTRAEDKVKVDGQEVDAEFDQGTTLTISSCTVNTSGEITGYRENIGGILGTTLDYNSAEGKNNIVHVVGCSVVKAKIKSWDSSGAKGKYIGGIIGYSSYNGDKDSTDSAVASKAQDLLSIIVTIEGCTVGSDSVSIEGYTSIGGIAGAMSKVQGGYISGCKVDSGATIKATAACSNIGGLVGNSDAASSDSELTMSFKGKNEFYGTINLNSKTASSIGGIIGEMSQGASFDKGSEIIVGKSVSNTIKGSIINPGASSSNIGGVAGLTSGNVAFSGSFTVKPSMSTSSVENVGGFIGKNDGQAHILSEDTTITIGGSISGSQEVGGFVGVNNEGATLAIGENSYRGASRLGSLTITVEAGTSITANKNNAGGLVGKNDKKTNNKAAAVVNIVKGTITNKGTVQGVNNVGGIVGLNEGDLQTGGGEGTYSALSITNEGAVTATTSYAGGVFGTLNAGTISGTFTNKGTVTGNTSYVGGSIGYMADGVVVSNSTLKNESMVVGKVSYVGGSIGYMAAGSRITSTTLENSGTVEGKGADYAADFVGGSIGYIASTTRADFGGAITAGTLINSNTVSGKDNVGGSIGKLEGVISGSFTNGGTVTGTSNVGGVVGAVSNIGNISGTCSNTLNVTGTSNVGGTVGDNDGTISASCTNSGKVSGTNNVGGSIGEQDGTISGSFTNRGEVSGALYVGGSVGKLGGSVSGTFSNSNKISGTSYVGGAIGYAAGSAQIKSTTGAKTTFDNTGAVEADGYFAGGSIGILYGSIVGNATYKVEFKVSGTSAAVKGISYVGGSIGVIAGSVSYAQFVNEASLSIDNAVTAIGGSVGFVGLPSIDYVDESLNIGSDTNYSAVSNGSKTIVVNNSHFEAKGNLSVGASTPSGAAESTSTVGATTSGGVGGAIGVIGGESNKLYYTNWTDNTYYASGNVEAPSIDNVGGVFGLIRAKNFEVNNMLAHKTTVKGRENVGGIVGAIVDAVDTGTSGVKIKSTFAIEGSFEGASGSKNVGGIVGLTGSDTDASTSYWVLGQSNENITSYTIAQLVEKLGKSTGSAKTGWYFIYANNANGSDGLGTINAAHHSSDEENLKYWKRIANAYSADEKASGANTTTLTSSIVKGSTAPAQSTIYATATAAAIAKGNTGYYLYTATSGDKNPTIEHYYDAYSKSAFYISVNTADNSTSDTLNTVGNFVVYYRKITGKNLTYNGYERDAVVGMSDVGKVDSATNKAGKYFYESTVQLSSTDESGNTVQSPSSIIKDPGTYIIRFEIFYYVSNGEDNNKDRFSVGGVENLSLTIGKRVLETDVKVANNKTYGQVVSNADTGDHDMKITLSNVAPNEGLDKPIKIIVKNNSGTVIAAFTWHNGIFDEAANNVLKTEATSNGVTISGLQNDGAPLVNDEDKYFAAQYSDIDTTKEYVFVIDFTKVNSYTVEIANTTGHYTVSIPDNKFSVAQRTLNVEAKWSGTPTESNGVKQYTYNVSKQGVTAIMIDKSKGGTTTEGLIDGDIVCIDITIYKKNTSKVYTKYGEAISVMIAQAESFVDAVVPTLDAGEYKITYGINQTQSGTNNAENYSIEDSNKHEWVINKYVINLSNALPKDLGSKVYDGKAVTFELSINDSNLSSDGTKFTYNGDEIQVVYSASVNGSSKTEIKNQGTYNIVINSSNGKIEAKHGNGVADHVSSNASHVADNYTVGDTEASSTYTILPRTLTLTWNAAPSNSYVTGGWVYDKNLHGLTVSGATSNDNMTHTAKNQSLTSATIVGCEGDTIVLTCSGAEKDVCRGKTMTASITGGTNGGEKSLGNYQLTGGNSSVTSDKSFKIVQSKLQVASASATATKVYDKSNATPSNTAVTYSVTSANNGDKGNNGYFSYTTQFEGTDVGKRQIKITFTYSGSTGGNYTYDKKTYEFTVDGGEITPAPVKVVLNKLRSNKATRTFNNDTTYGGGTRTGNGNSSIYRAGEGYTVSGILSADDSKVTITAVYAEAGTDRAFFDSYVNNVYKSGSEYKQLATNDTNRFYKKLVFTMDGDEAKNYSFNVYNSSDKAYSDTVGTGKGSSVTVYDSSDNASGHSNASDSGEIHIEITIASVRVTYSNTYQSYANDDNTYNTNWTAVEGTIKIGNKTQKAVMNNGWMYVNGVDGTKKEYRGYTVIRGSSTSKLLSAAVDTTNGMQFNYRLSNQPTLTIAYFVSESDDFEIDSLATLLIASFYYSASQNADAPGFTQIVQSGYKWHEVVSNTDYEAGANVPEGYEGWDAYFEYLEGQGYSVFYNAEASSDNDNMKADTWGYYETTETGGSTIPSKFKQVKDISGTLTAADIALLDSFFSIHDESGTTTRLEWGYGKTYLSNLLTSSAGSIATIEGSLFVTTTRDSEGNIVGGFSGTYDGNGYVIEYLNIVGYGKKNVGLFDIIDSGVVKNIHLRNVTINADSGNVGGIAGRINANATEGAEVYNVSFHGAISVSGNACAGGLFGVSNRSIEQAIVLGTISSSASGAAVGGIVGVTEIGKSIAIDSTVSLVQINAKSDKHNGSEQVSPFVGRELGSAVMSAAYHMQNAVLNKNAFVNVALKAISYADLMSGSITGYGSSNRYYYQTGSTASAKGKYDVLDDVTYIIKTSDESGAGADNARQSMRLYDIVSVYLLMYSIDATTGENNVNVYAISADSWLVGTKHGTSADDAIVIANKQNVSLLRELRFATFELIANVEVELSSPISGAFYGSVSAGIYKIACNRSMFEVYLNNDAASTDIPDWLTVKN